MLNSRSWLSARSWAALLALSLLGANTVFAQRNDYKVAPGRDESFDIPPEAKPAAAAKIKADVRDKRNNIRESLREADLAFNKERETAFDKWYLGYEFPTMTLYTSEALKDLYDARKRLFKDDLERANNSQARDHLVDIAFKFFKDVAREDFHPAVRYNAMLIVGELDARPAVRVGNGTPPVPVRAALPFMIQEFKNPDQIDAVRLAALLGINRHVQLNSQSATIQPGDAIPQADLLEIRTLALELVKTREAPASRTQDGHDWMRRRGLEILSWLAAGKPDQELVDEIIARLSDSDENRGIRAEAALALNVVKLKPEAGTSVTIKPKEVAASLLQFVTDAVTADVERVDKYVKSMEEASEIYTSSAGGGGFSGGRGRSGGGMSGMGKGGSSMGPTPGGSGGGSKSGGSSMGPPPGGGSSGSKSGGSSMGPMPGGGSSAGSKSGGSSMGPPPGGGSSRGGSGGMSGMSGMGRGGFGGSGADAADPYAYRLDPVYRKLRYEIGCAMKGLRGIDVYRSGDGPGGLYRAQLTPEDKEYIGRAAMALRDVGDKLRKKTDELTTKAFVVEKLDLDKLTKLTNEVVAKAKPKAAGPELKDPLSEPDPADDVLPPEEAEAKTTGAGKKKK